MFHPSIMYVITPAIADGTVIADKLFKKKVEHTNTERFISGKKILQ